MRDFLARARITEDFAGDLITDMRHDETLPPSFGSIREMRDYLISCNACPEALEAAPEVWRRYSAWRKRR
jgi:hypothetical protein